MNRSFPYFGLFILLLTLICSPFLVPTVYAGEIEGSGEVKVQYHYDRAKAVEYALDNANEGRDEENLFEEDCTNFVSHSLLAGGWPMVQPPFWYHWLPHFPPFSWIREIIEKDNRFWFFYNKDDCSHSWTVVKDLYKFIEKSGRANPVVKLSKEDKTQWTQIEEGDIIQIIEDKKGVYHSMIVTNTSGGEPKLTYHTVNTKDQSLLQIMAKYPDCAFYWWPLKNSFDK